ncbi:hypothetical protein DFH06DRAFT_1159439 [Mycena polygramma]|nr:hypothetical protein DFH06DRAFT_1159439 [Mycena polygramma]
MTSADFPIDSAPVAGCSLPLELEREIFETAAVRHPDLIPTLLLVCHRAHAWVEPLLYRVLSFSDSSTILAAQNKSTEFLQTAVRHVFFEIQLFFEIQSRSSTETDLFRKCTGATNVYVYGVAALDLLIILDKMRLQKLSFVMENELPLSTLQRPLFHSVTHLDLYLLDGDDTLLPLVWQEWSHLAALPALSHLCLSQQLHTDVLPRALTECTRLSLAIAAFWESNATGDAVALAGSPTVRDPRCVVMIITDFETEWNIGARGGADFWVRAEEFIARKRRGEIEGSCYLLQE